MTVTLDETPAVDLEEPAPPPADPVAPRPFDAADEDSAGLLLAGMLSVAVWLLVAVTVWRKVARHRSKQ